MKLFHCDLKLLAAKCFKFVEMSICNAPKQYRRQWNKGNHLDTNYVLSGCFLTVSEHLNIFPSSQVLRAHLHEDKLWQNMFSSQDVHSPITKAGFH